jgi:hypothetical protein
MPRTPLECAEADQPFAATGIEQRLAAVERRAIENGVAHVGQAFERLPSSFGVAARAPLEQPLRPDVALPRRRG